jgi:aldose 1-epimerase
MPEFDVVTLRDPSSSLSATYVPAAGMICTSLADDDVEFLGQRRGLDAYVTDGKTMGIPILYPWANRLSATTYEVDGTTVSLTVGSDGVRADEHGAPIHGVLAAYPRWQATATDNTLVAQLDYGADPRLLASFPFPHILTQHITLADRTLSIETTVTPTTEAAVPLCFGYHPYFTIPGVPRAEWTLTAPGMRRLPVDSRGIPTGESQTWKGASGPLGETTYDDGFDDVPGGAVFTLGGGDRRIDVTFEKGYPAAQLFAPPTDSLVAIEPMAAPTDALIRGDYRCATVDDPQSLRFSIRVG